MKKLTLFISVLLIMQFGNAQITFQKTIGGLYADRGLSIQQTSDSGYIITGYTDINNNSDVFLFKTTYNGDTIWTKIFATTEDDEGTSVEQTSDGGYIIVGKIENVSTVGGKVYLIKTDSNGDTLWTKTYGGTNYSGGYSVQQTSDGGYIITGYTNSFGAGYDDIYLIKTDANGNSLWSKTFGRAYIDEGYSVQQTTDGGYVIVGYTAYFGGVDTDVYLIKTDSNGDSLWTKTYGGPNYEAGTSIQQTTDGGYIIAGRTNSFGAGDADVYLIKTDGNGGLLWTKTFGGTSLDGGSFVQQTLDGGYIIAGYTSLQDVYLIKTDALGNPLWTKTFGGSSLDEGFSVQQTLDGGYIIVGSTQSFGTNVDVYLIKTDSFGNSGCNEGNPATIVTTPATQITNTSTIVASPATIVTTPTTVVGSGCIVTALCSSVGINKVETGNLFFISPNPSGGNFIISFEKTIMKGDIQILNILGENVFAKNIFNESNKEINLKNVSDGIYFVKVFDGEKSYCKKLIVE